MLLCMGKKTSSPTLTQHYSSVTVCVKYLDCSYYSSNVSRICFFSLDGVQKTKSLDDQQHQSKKLCLGHYWIIKHFFSLDLYFL